VGLGVGKSFFQLLVTCFILLDPTDKQYFFTILTMNRKMIYFRSEHDLPYLDLISKKKARKKQWNRTATTIREYLYRVCN